MGWFHSKRAIWSQFLRLSWSERAVVIETLLLLPLVLVAQKLLGFDRCRAILERLGTRVGSSRRGASDVLTEARATSRLFDRGARHCPCRTSCTHRSLVLWWLLRRRGITSQLWIGVQKEANRFQAHAWVECLGHVLNDPDRLHCQFAPFPRPLLV